MRKAQGISPDFILMVSISDLAFAVLETNSGLISAVCTSLLSRFDMTLTWLGPVWHQVPSVDHIYVVRLCVKKPYVIA